MVQRAGSLSWGVLVNSGHLVPMNQPEAASAMINGFLENSLKKSEETGVTATEETSGVDPSTYFFI